MYSLLILSRSAWLNVKSGAVELTEEICLPTAFTGPNCAGPTSELGFSCWFRVVPLPPNEYSGDLGRPLCMPRDAVPGPGDHLPANSLLRSPWSKSLARDSRSPEPKEKGRLGMRVGNVSEFETELIRSREDRRHLRQSR